MRQYLVPFLSGIPLLFGSFSSSPTYQLQSYGINGAASNSSTSPTYDLEGETGQVQSVPASSPTYKGLSGSLQAQQADVPPAPTLSNGSGTYYNKLGLIINVGGNASDATYSVAVSSNGFTTTNYVQASGALGTTPFFQNYTAWGGVSGTTIVGLASGTSYEVEVSAMEGQFTNSAYGPYASSTTASPSVSFSITPTTLTLPALLTGAVETGATMSSTFATNGNYGGNIYVSDSNAGLKSLSRSYTIASIAGNLSSLTHGYGLQGVTATQTSGGPMSISATYNGTVNVVGALTTTPQILFTTSAAVTGGSATSRLLAKAASTDSAATDYTDTLTFIAAASF
jgi:hypothetical protein